MKTRFSCMMLAILLATFLVTPMSSFAGPDPTESLRQTIEKIQTTLNGTMMSEQAKHKAVNQIVFDRLDSDGICKRTLGRHYAAHAGRFDEFCAAFMGLIEKNLMGKVGGVSNVQIVYGKQKIEGDFATLDTKLIDAKSNEIPVSYRMRLVAGEWKVYDVAVEGISMVSNYRSQFNTIIFQFSFDELLRRLKEKNLGG